MIFLLALCFADQPSAADSQKWQAFFEKEVTDLEGRFAKEVQTKADWETKRTQYRQELKEMLGLDPEPARSDLKPVITGQLEAHGIVVENLHFQAMPGLYVTANFYRPAQVAEVTQKLPTILYLCGHGGMMGKDGRSNGNKAHYQHHGIWFAQHGYTCLVIDTVQWGEFLGEHWGTYRLNRWWWLARGYTPAGLEAWSGIRALDYLATRPEVDMEKIGCTGRSGGGAYTWYVTALDNRVEVTCPTAGITTLRDHVLGNCIEGHCDCMFMNNFHRWDFDKLAALSAPRPLLISNTDKDDIFPLGGVMRIYNGTRRLYALLGKEKSIGLQLAEGPHKDTQPLNMGAFHWFDRFLKGTDPMAVIKEPAMALFKPDQLRVFKDLPKDEINTRIDESFVPAFKTPPVPETKEQWEAMKTQWLAALREKVFTKWNPVSIPSEPTDKHHFLRRCALLGLPFDQLQTVGSNRPHAFSGVAAVEGLYDVILHGSKAQMSLIELPISHRQGPFYFNILRYMDIPQAVAMAAETCQITITGRAEDWAWATQTAEKMGFGKNLTIVPEMELLSVQKLWDASGHQAFTDIVRYKDEWFCVFREGSSHVPGTNGTIRVLTSKDARHWESTAVLTENGIDLRDPKICIMPDGRLMITLGGSSYDGKEGVGEKRKLTGARSRVSFSTDGHTWTAPQPVSKDGDWLWRVTPDEKSAYGMSYTHTAADQNFKLHLWKTTDGLTHENIANPDLGRQCWPNETTLRFLPDHTMQALVRNERKGGHTFYGTAAPPYKTWTWTDTGEIIQGPHFLRLSDGRTIYAGRDFVSGKANTTLGRLSPDGYATPLLVLPSGGDTSYPGLAQAPDGTLLISYYSSHEGKSAIYLATVTVH
jgi:dienelactone hydrolase